MKRAIRLINISNNNTVVYWHVATDTTPAHWESKPQWSEDKDEAYERLHAARKVVCADLKDEIKVVYAKVSKADSIETLETELTDLTISWSSLLDKNIKLKKELVDIITDRDLQITELEDEVVELQEEVKKLKGVKPVMNWHAKPCWCLACNPPDMAPKKPKCTCISPNDDRPSRYHVITCKLSGYTRNSDGTYVKFFPGVLCN